MSLNTKGIQTEIPVAIIFIGIQGSGKSTYYRRELAKNYIHISLDTLKTRAREQQVLQECIRQGKSFVVDNTNPTIDERARYIRMAKEAGYRIVGCFFQSKLQECIRRNNQRQGKERLPITAIAATSNKLELPSMQE